MADVDDTVDQHFPRSRHRGTLLRAGRPVTTPARLAVAVVTPSRVSLMHRRRLIVHKERPSHIRHCGGMLVNDPESGELAANKLASY